ncbi:MAG: YhbY family RNA-binding protein [Casimicrobiaceae bacterium]
MKLELSPDARRALRAKAHHLEPVVMIGNDGLTPAVLHEIDINLCAHGLIKIRVFSDARDARESFLTQIAEELDAAAVQHIGKLLVIFRPLPEPEKPARKPRIPLSRSGTGAPRAPTAPRARAPRASERRKPVDKRTGARGIPGRRRTTQS